MSTRHVCDGGCNKAFPADWQEQQTWWSIRLAVAVGSPDDIHLCPDCFARHFHFASGVPVDNTTNTQREQQHIQSYTCVYKDCTEPASPGQEFCRKHLSRAGTEVPTL